MFVVALAQLSQALTQATEHVDVEHLIGHDLLQAHDVHERCWRR
ncbi:hypothetical protein [Micromonospora rhizosphaerae]|nr:hypothetical protein [Micromonospora rhizosphaerae]